MAEKETAESLDIKVITPDEIFSSNLIFLGMSEQIKKPIYQINEKEVTIKDPDFKLEDFNLHMPPDEGILYMMLDEAVVLFGKDFNAENSTILLSILQKADSGETELVVNVMYPTFQKNPKWYKVYTKRVDQFIDSLEKFVTADVVDETTS